MKHFNCLNWKHPPFKFYWSGFYWCQTPVETWPARPAWLPLVLINTAGVCHPLPHHGESQWVLGWAATCLLGCNDANKGAWQGLCGQLFCIMRPWLAERRRSRQKLGGVGVRSSRQTVWLIPAALQHLTSELRPAPVISTRRPGGRRPVRDWGGKRGWEVGVKVVGGDSQGVQWATPGVCPYHHDNWGRRSSFTPGGNRKHHLHVAHSPAHPNRLTWFTQSADMKVYWDLWSKPALLFSAWDKTVL